MHQNDNCQKIKFCLKIANCFGVVVVAAAVVVCFFFWGGEIYLHKAKDISNFLSKETSDDCYQ